MKQSIDADVLSRLDSVLERLFRRMRAQSSVNQFGLTATQLFVLRYLSLEGDAKSSDISRTAGLSPGAITQVCDDLVRLGFVNRVRSKEDRRVVYIHLTPSGNEQLQKFLAYRTLRLKQQLDKLADDDALQLIALLEKLVDVMELD